MLDGHAIELPSTLFNPDVADAAIGLDVPRARTSAPLGIHSDFVFPVSMPGPRFIP